MDDEYDETDDQNFIDAESQKGPFDSWINLEAVRRYIRNHLSKFLTQWAPNGRVVYYPLIKEMVLENKQSLCIDFRHLASANSHLAKWLAYHPIHLIPELNAALYSIVGHAFPNYKQNFA
jgi:DNA replicative helicase MCM subunit Mcm2 (Cdc46/Mcm family)